MLSRICRSIGRNFKRSFDTIIITRKLLIGPALEECQLRARRSDVKQELFYNTFLNYCEMILISWTLYSVYFVGQPIHKV